MKKSLNEIHRTLNTNGKFICLEFSQVNKKMLRKLVDIYFSVIPKLGRIITRNEPAYDIL